MRRAGCPSERLRGGVGGKLLVFLAVLFAFAALAWMLCLPVLLTSRIRARTGFDARVERFAVNPFSGFVELRGLVVSNPPTFASAEFLDVRAFTAEVDLLTLFADRLVIDRMRLDLARVTLIKRSDGATNAVAFQRNLDAPAGAPVPASAPQKFLIRDLQLRIDRVVVVDQTARTPMISEFDVRLDHRYADVTDVEQLLAPAALRQLAPLGAAISGLLPGHLGQAVAAATREAAQSGAQLLKRTGRRAEESVRGLFDALEESKKP